jgi:hypothetical protein
MSIDEFANTTPVRPPIVNRNTNPSAHKHAALYVMRVPYMVASHQKILIPVGTAIFIVADVKYARVSTSIPTVNTWWDHTTNHAMHICHASLAVLCLLNRSWWTVTAHLVVCKQIK